MRRGLVGRIVLALLATSLMAAALYWGVLRNDTSGGNGTRVELDVTRLENGPAPTHFDSGQPAVISKDPGDPGADLVINDGKLTFAPTKDGAAAAFYGSPDMNGSITGLGARWVFQARGDGLAGSISLVVSHGSESTPPTVIPPVPIQFIVTPLSWNLSIKKDNASELSPVAAGNFNPPLKVDGTTAYEVRLSIDGSRVTMNLPDGTKRNVNDARIAQWQGNYAIFGLYLNDSLNGAIGGFEKIWATSGEGEK